eukprot:TRINITY_DN62101_c0_g1_i1.p1 TRINITY_DN62101_c0_g1~~TRINITY_DN62101_c0_g1_i1.p1  ORF type:complete len:300 (-),score=49.80 TRINITY_DN62101_c0_g1_i1:248-1147(-)
MAACPAAAATSYGSRQVAPAATAAAPGLSGTSGGGYGGRKASDGGGDRERDLRGPSGDRDCRGPPGVNGERDRGRGDRGSSAPIATASGIIPEQHAAHAAVASAATGELVAGAVVAGSPPPAAGVPMSNYSFFVRYTYSKECALLAYNFHKLVTRLGIFEQFAYRHDHRLISVTLAYIFYRYQVHHCDMALDLAVTLVYLEDVRAEPELEMQEYSRDAFNLICYLAFLAHAFNADRTIRLTDWYKEIGWRSFKNCRQLNGFVFFLFSRVRKYRLRVPESRVKKYIQKLCSVPSQVNSEA